MGGIGSGRKKVYEVPANRRFATMSYRYPIAKKDFLFKAYAERLPGILREMTDQLIVRAVNEVELKTVNK